MMLEGSLDSSRDTAQRRVACGESLPESPGAGRRPRSIMPRGSLDFSRATAQRPVACGESFAAKRRRRETIPARGNAPGSQPISRQALKGRPISLSKQLSRLSRISSSDLGAETANGTRLTAKYVGSICKVDESGCHSGPGNSRTRSGFKAGLQPAPLCTRVHPGWTGTSYESFPARFSAASRPVGFIHPPHPNSP